MKNFNQSSKLPKNITHKERIEDTTMYGEVIPSLFNWTNPDRQRERIQEIEEGVKNESLKNEGQEKQS